MKETGMKYDSDKPMMDLIPPAAEIALARVLTFGANKYAPNSWQTVEDGERRYMAAAMRHINAHRSGEMFDEESGELHLSHALTCLAFLVEMAFKNAPTEAEALADEYAHDLAETQKIFDDGEKRADDIGQNGNDGSAYPLTLEQLITDNWYCLQHDLEVRSALVGMGMQVWAESYWGSALDVCCMPDSSNIKVRPYCAAILSKWKTNAYEIRLINGQFYRV